MLLGLWATGGSLRTTIAFSNYSHYYTVLNAAAVLQQSILSNSVMSKQTALLTRPAEVSYNEHLLRATGLVWQATLPSGTLGTPARKSALLQRQTNACKESFS